MFKTLILAGVLFVSFSLNASETVTTEPDSKSYNFVSSYSVTIQAPLKSVWPHINNLRSWMYEFDMAHVSGNPGAVGSVSRLYPGQDFFMQIIEAVPPALLVLANLPSQFNGEFSTGIGVVHLNSTETGTEVTLTMSRRYTWNGEGDNPQKRTRQSREFQEETAARWHRFLERLKQLSEQGNALPASFSK